MKRLLISVCLLLLLAPASAHAARQSPPVQRYCAPGVIETNVTAVRQPMRCLAGYVMRANEKGMEIRYPGKGIRIVRFRADTEFQSNSALGTFDGLQRGDFVCLTVIKPAFVLRALLVIMDTQQFACTMHRVRRDGTVTGKPRPQPTPPPKMPRTLRLS